MSSAAIAEPTNHRPVRRATRPPIARRNPNPGMNRMPPPPADPPRPCPPPPLTRAAVGWRNPGAERRCVAEPPAGMDPRRYEEEDDRKERERNAPRERSQRPELADDQQAHGERDRGERNAVRPLRERAHA